MHSEPQRFIRSGFSQTCHLYELLYQLIEMTGKLRGSSWNNIAVYFSVVSSYQK